MGLLTPLAIRLGRWWWTADRLPQIVTVDRLLHRVSGGRVSVLDLAGLPNLMLTVIGRTSGAPRSTPLLAVADGAHFVIAGSNWGRPEEPQWVRNLEAAGSAQITVEGATHDVRARLVEGTERDRAWALLVDAWPNFAVYEQRTDRAIKVFELTPDA